MRYWVGLVLVLALVASPLRTYAEDNEKTQSDGPSTIAYLLIPEHLQERLPGERHKKPPPTEKSPPPKPTPAPLTPQERKVRGAKIGLGVSGGCTLAGLIVVGAAVGVGAGSIGTNDPGPDITVPLITGLTVVGAGTASMIATAILLRVRRKDLREQQQSHYRTRRRAQWDPARSRLVF